MIQNKNYITYINCILSIPSSASDAVLCTVLVCKMWVM